MNFNDTKYEFLKDTKFTVTEKLKDTNFDKKKAEELIKGKKETLREKCPNTGFFLLLIFPHSD